MSSATPKDSQHGDDRLVEALKEARDTLDRLWGYLREDGAEKHAQGIAVVENDLAKIDALLQGNR